MNYPVPCKLRFIHESPDDPDVIHVVSRRAQTDKDTTINIGAAECRHKRKRVVITDGEVRIRIRILDTIPIFYSIVKLIGHLPYFS